MGKSDFDNTTLHPEWMEFVLMRNGDECFSLHLPSHSRFDDLHGLLCSKLKQRQIGNYLIELPRIKRYVRQVTRLHDIHGDEIMDRYVSVNDEMMYRCANIEVRLRVKALGFSRREDEMHRYMEHSLKAFKDAKEHHQYMRVHRPHLDNMHLIYELLYDFVKLKPWNDLRNHLVLVFNLKSYHLFRYVYVQVQRQDMELLFFEDFKAFSRYYRVQHDTAIQTSVKNRYRHALCIRITPLHLMRDERFDTWNQTISKDFGYQVYLLDQRYGYADDVISNDQAKTLLRLLPVCLKMMPELSSNSASLPSLIRVPYIGYDPLHRHVLVQYGELKLYNEEPLIYPDAQNIEHLKKCRKMVDAYELDYGLLEKEENFHKDERVSYRLEAVCMGARYKNMRISDIVNEQAIETLLTDLLIDLIETCGRPSRLYVRDMHVKYILKDICDDLSIKIHVLGSLVYIDALWKYRHAQKKLKIKE